MQQARSTWTWTEKWISREWHSGIDNVQVSDYEFPMDISDVEQIMGFLLVPLQQTTQESH